MVAAGQKFGVDGRSSSGGSYFDATDNNESFPGVPYTKEDFNDYRCIRDIEDIDYESRAENVSVGNQLISRDRFIVEQSKPGLIIYQVRNCRLVGLVDLDQSRRSVRMKIVGYLNKLIAYGVAGFRYTNVHYPGFVSAAARGESDWKDLATLGPGFGDGNYNDNDALVSIDDHDNQRDDHRYALNYKDGPIYQVAIAFMLAWPYGYARVMSGFSFLNRDQGPPNLGPFTGYATRSPTFNPRDGTCVRSSGWMCEHRFPSIRQMSRFRASTHGAAASMIVTDTKRIAFARLGKGFFALNAQDDTWNKEFNTTLPAGLYCDHFTGGRLRWRCAEESIRVGRDGIATLSVSTNKPIAISLASRIGRPPRPVLLDLYGYRLTVVLMKKKTALGENLFIRGGNPRRGECLYGPYQQKEDPCAIPIMHRTTVPSMYSEYSAWSQGDLYLDFEGEELGQGTHFGKPSSGTPLVYSTNRPNSTSYQQYNRFGDDYWMVTLLMDCSKTDKGWFELKGYNPPHENWEPDIKQSKCGGVYKSSAPSSSKNHVAKCGAVNVFKWGRGDGCIINDI
ncbi:hypothetical protein Q1695_003706 [Nippostrongylus brasiliensis]|nr:hypothetical protein Q1695_003706 [Nippostrongylus brasiliensis]